MINGGGYARYHPPHIVNEAYYFIPQVPSTQVLLLRQATFLTLTFFEAVPSAPYAVRRTPYADAVRKLIRNSIRVTFISYETYETDGILALFRSLLSNLLPSFLHPNPRAVRLVSICRPLPWLPLWFLLRTLSGNL